MTMMACYNVDVSDIPMALSDRSASKEKKYKHKFAHEKRLKAAKKIEKISSDPNQMKITSFRDQATKMLAKMESNINSSQNLIEEILSKLSLVEIRLL